MRHAIAVAALAALTGQAFASSSLTVYTSRAAWEAAAGGGAPDCFENFEGFHADTLFPVAANGFSLSATDTSFRNLVDVLPAAFDDNNGTNGASMYVDGDNPVTCDLALDNPASAWGADFFLESPGGSINEGLSLYIETSDGGTHTIDVTGTLDHFSNAFLGVVASAGVSFTNVRFQANLSGLGGGEGFTMDNVACYDIPTPGAAAVLGLAGLCGIRRRR